MSVFALGLLLFGRGSSDAAYIVNASNQSLFYGIGWISQAPEENARTVKYAAIQVQANSWVVMPGIPNDPQRLYNWYYLFGANSAANYNNDIYLNTVIVNDGDHESPTLYVRISEPLVENWILRREYLNNSAAVVNFTPFLSITPIVLSPGDTYSHRVNAAAGNTFGLGSVPNMAAPYSYHYPVIKPLDAVLEGTYVTAWDGSSWSANTYSVSGSATFQGVHSVTGGSGGTNTPTGGGSTTNIVDNSAVVSAVTAQTTLITGIGTTLSSILTAVTSTASAVAGLGTSLTQLIADLNSARLSILELINLVFDGIKAFFVSAIAFFTWVADYPTHVTAFLHGYLTTTYDNALYGEALQNWTEIYTNNLNSDAHLQSGMDRHGYALSIAGVKPEPYDFTTGSNPISQALHVITGLWSNLGNFFARMFSWLELNTDLLISQRLENQIGEGPNGSHMVFLNKWGAEAMNLQSSVTVLMDTGRIDHLRTFFTGGSTAVTGVTLVRSEWVVPVNYGGPQGLEVSLFPGDHPLINGLIVAFRSLLCFFIGAFVTWLGFKHLRKALQDLNLTNLRAIPSGQSILGFNLNYMSIVANAAFYVGIAVSYVAAYVGLTFLFNGDFLGISEFLGLMNGSQPVRMAVGMINYCIPIDFLVTSVGAVCILAFVWTPIQLGFQTVLRVAHV